MTHVTIVCREPTIPDDILVERLTPIIARCYGKPESFTAHLDQEYVGGRGFVTTAHLGNVGTILHKRADGSYVAECPEAVYEMQEAQVCQEAAERLRRAVVDREAALPF